MYEAFSTFYDKFVFVSYEFLKSFSNHQDQHQAAHLLVETENQLYSVRFDIQSVASNNRVCMLVMD